MPALAPAAPAITPAAPAAPAAPVPFALGPSQAIHGVIDFNTKEGLSMFKNNTRCLYNDKTNLFAADAEGLVGFLNNMAERANEADWNDVLEVPLDLAQPQVNMVPFLQNNGHFDLNHLMVYTATYVGAHNRAAQDNHQIVIAIMASLAEDAKAKIIPWQAQYKFNHVTSAMGLIKVIIRESHIDSNATTRRIRTNLSSLDVHMKLQGNDVTKLNTLIQQQLTGLRARGEATLDLLPNLFKGYVAAEDENFQAYIKEKKSRYDEGLDDPEITPELLMTLASNKYKVMVDTGLWMAPNKEQVKILALKSQIKQLSDKKSGKARTENYVRPAWMNVKPSDEDIASDKTKTVEGKKYWWCQKHGYYCQHSTEKCRGASKKAKETPSKPTEEKDNKTLKLAKALQAAIEEDSESESA